MGSENLKSLLSSTMDRKGEEGTFKIVQYSSLYNDNGYNRNCVTGDRDHLYSRLKELILKAKKIDIIVAFLMESGVRILEEDF